MGDEVPGVLGEVAQQAPEQVAEGEEEEALPPPCVDLTEYPLKIGRTGTTIVTFLDPDPTFQNKPNPDPVAFSHFIILNCFTSF